MKYRKCSAEPRPTLTMRVGVALLIASAGFVARGQTPSEAGTGSHVWVASAQMSSVQEPAPGEVVREIDDLHTGSRWLLMRDASHPGGPGRLVLVEGTGNGIAQDQTEVKPTHAEHHPVLRAGDRLIVEENTQRVEARFEAVALGPAAPGSVLAVRLKIGGKVVRAVALAPGRAMLQAGTEAYP